MGTKDLPDVYAQSPSTEGICIRQIMSTHVTSNMYHFQHSENCPNLQVPALLIYITMSSNCDYGIFILMFSWHLFIQDIIVVSIVGLELLNMCYSFYSKTTTQK